MKKFFLSAISFIFMATSLLVAEDKSEIDGQIETSVKKAASTLNWSLAEASLMMNTEPDAYIGKIYPSVPCHLNAGLNVSGTLITTTDITEAVTKMNSAINADMGLKQIGTSAKLPSEIVNLIPDLQFPSQFVVPTAAVSARLGGIVIPFDLGLFGIASIPGSPVKAEFGNMSLNSELLCLGADIRFALYEGGTIMPKISLGFGYIYSKNSYGFSVSKTDTDYSYDSDDSSKKGTLNSNYNINIAINYQTFYAQLQVSKKLLCFIPYVGFRAKYTMYDSGYSWDYYTKVTTESSETAETNGKNSGTIKTGLDDFKINAECLNPTLYGGIGFKVPFFEFGLNVSWNIASNAFTGGILTTFKL